MKWFLIACAVVAVFVILRHVVGLRRSVAHVRLLLRDSQNRRLKSEKMAALGTISAGLAHELNTPVGAVTCMNSSRASAFERLRNLLAERAPDLKDDSDVARCFKAVSEGDRVIEAGLEQVSSLLHELRGYSANEKARPVRVDLHERIDGALLLLRNQLKNRIEVRKDYGDLPEVPCFPVRLTQILLNLFSNAAKAVPAEGVLEVATRVEDGYAVISVRDDGVGIPADQIDRIFEYGFTTRAERGGMGLGLAITRDLVRHHHGEIDVESEPGEGTTFTFTLPLDLDHRQGDRDRGGR